MVIRPAIATGSSLRRLHARGFVGNTHEQRFGEACGNRHGERINTANLGSASA
jgi:hypothetical protein